MSGLLQYWCRFLLFSSAVSSSRAIDESDETETLRVNRRPIGHRKGSRTGQRASSLSASPFGSVHGLFAVPKEVDSTF